MSNHLLRILCLIVLSALYGCSSGSSEGGISGTGGPPKIIVNGQAEKGPFLKRSEVTYHYINEEGETLSEDFSTTTSDDMGSFSLALNDPGLIEIRVSGYHYDEINNQISDGLLTLNGLYIADDEEAQAARVNLLTHIIHDRVLMLMADENLSAGLAVTQAEQELLGELESIIPKVGVNDFSQLSVYNRENANENGNAYLLLFSAALYQHAINNTPDGSSLSGQLTGVLNILTDDFEDGALDASSQLIDGLALAIQQLDATEIVSNLEGRSNDVLGETLDVPDFSGFIGQFLITFPAEDATLSETTPVRLEVPSGLKNVTLDLMVDGLVVDSITEAPYEFTWDPYYWSTDSTSRHTLLVKASNAVGAEIVSNLVPVSVLASSNSQLSLTSPVDSQIVENSDSVSLQWGLYEGASQYKVQVAGASSFTNILYETTTSTNQFDLTGLDVGSYFWRIQAIDNEEREGAWSESIAFLIQAPQTPELQMPSFGTVIRDTATPTLSWSAVESAASYQIQIAPNIDFSSSIIDEMPTSENFATSTLSAGNYFWRVRSIDGVGHESEFSSTNSFVVEGPLPPEGITSEWSSNGDQYDVTINWQAAEHASSYELQTAADSSFTSGVTNTSVASESANTSLAVGEYFTRVRSINSGGIVGDWSESINLSIGVFTTRLGGGGHDLPSHILATSSGQYLILASTTSRGDSQGDDWIFKLNENGEMVWEYLHTSPGYPIFSELVELSNGDIVGFGSTGNLANRIGLIVLLNADGTKKWEKEYTNPSFDYLFINGVAEREGVVYIVSEGKVCTTTGSRRTCLSQAPIIESISLEDGSITSSLQLENVNGAPWENVSSFSITSAGDFLLSFSVFKPDCIDYVCAGAGMAIVNTLGQLDTEWNSMSVSPFLNGGYAVETPQGGFVLSGQLDGMATAEDGVPVAFFNSDGVYSGTYIFSDAYSNQKQYIAFGDNGLMFQLVSKYSVDWPILISIDSYGHSEEKLIFSNLNRESDPAALASTSDGGLVFLFREPQSGNGNSDVVVVKMGPLNSL